MIFFSFVCSCSSIDCMYVLPIHPLIHLFFHIPMHSFYSLSLFTVSVVFKNPFRSVPFHPNHSPHKPSILCKKCSEPEATPNPYLST
ncbi:hypothetical protein EYC80_007519 [Monilinia laxa]|uniref:Uncharacterized protein n=1 Tax=Monilinia laxa TaxID=61186 RepID=A0A5N6JW62_MONLA|nr:hypothetical protein EYC80_007519 [Monilinia laxa]